MQKKNSQYDFSLIEELFYIPEKKKTVEEEKETKRGKSKNSEESEDSEEETKKEEPSSEGKYFTFIDIESRLETKNKVKIKVMPKINPYIAMEMLAKLIIGHTQNINLGAILGISVGQNASK